MGDITWAIETGIEPDYEKRLIASVRAEGCLVYSPSYVPFEARFDGVVDSEGPVVFHGSLQGAEVAKKSGMTVYENADQLLCSYYYPRIGDMCLNRRHVFLPFGSLTNMKDFLLSTLGAGSGCLFVRPDSNRKLFSGQVITRETWDRDVEFLGFYDDVVKPETMVVVAPPVNVVKEWRFFVSQGRVITGSLYVTGRDHTRRPADSVALSRAADFVEECTNRGYDPSPVWVLDLCETSSGGHHILEVGSFSSAGLYAADTDLLVRAVNATLHNNG